MQSAYSDLRELYEKFGLVVAENPMLLDKEHMKIRMEFLIEELEETAVAFNEQNLEEVVDGLIDLTYVALGTLMFMGVYFPDHWKEVHRANMEKERVDHAGESKRSYSCDLKKPKGWTPPNHKELLDWWTNNDGGP